MVNVETNPKRIILNYLREQFLMGIATLDKNGNLWPANVYYLVDENLNLYFLSSPNTVHSKNITSNHKIACTIANSNQKMSGEKIGIQLSGTCKRVKSLKYAKIIVNSYKNSKWIKDSLTLEMFKKAAISGIYKITPIKIKFFNTELFPEDNFTEIEL